MKVLLIHNKYKETGGEDAVFHAERQLLLNYRHDVEVLLFDNAAIKTRTDRMFSGIKLLYNPASARALKKKIEEFRPDIIHAHNFVPLASPSVFFIAAKYRVPLVLTLHNYRLICPGYTLFYKNGIYEKSVRSFFPIDAILKGVYRDSILQTAAVVMMTTIHKILGTWKNRIDVYIALTEFARKKFETSAISIPTRKLVVKPNFVSDHGIGDMTRQNFFLFVGRLTEEKGIRVLLKASALANFKLVILGDGPLREMVKDFADVNPNVSYMGFQDKRAVINHIKTCRALIFPSLWYECFPLTILEALCAGTIVVASRIGAMSEIIQDKVNGFHFETGDENDLVSRIVEINRSPEYLKAMSANARLTYLDYYTPERNYSRMMDIYNYALATKKQPLKSVIHPVRQLNNA